ncbi:hypothetical protein [Aquimarina rhabdastrellae]
MKHIAFFITLFLITFHVSSQLDTKKLGTSNTLGNRISAEKSYLSPNSSKKLGETSRINGLSLYKPTDSMLPLNRKKQHQGMRIESNLLSQEQGKTPKWFAKDNAFEGAHLKNQSLGSFKNNGKFVQVYCRDHQSIDGDRVRMYVNDQVAEPNILLNSDFIGFDIFLQEGFNRIEFEALNQGASGPNTAEFRLYDEKGNQISNKVWNLATGARARLTIIKE